MPESVPEDLPRQVVARREYAGAALEESAVAAEPLAQFRAWFDEAVARGVPEPDALWRATSLRRRTGAAYACCRSPWSSGRGG